MHTLNELLDAYRKHRVNVFFVQIGSNNGLTGDPLFPQVTAGQWKGILVEPIRELYDDLQVNYSKWRSNLIFENTAISKKNETLRFYRLKTSSDNSLPWWYNQLGSFHKDVIVSHRESIPGFDNLLMEYDVEAITFKSLLERHSVSRVDLVHIDAEGHDYEILEGIDFDQYKVEVVIFEHTHLKKWDFSRALMMLQEKGYAFLHFNNDSVAIRLSLLRELPYEIGKS